MTKYNNSVCGEAAVTATTTTEGVNNIDILLTEVFNKLTEKYLNTTDLPNPDVWREESELVRGVRIVKYKMVQISSETDDNIYLVSQLRYLEDTGNTELVLLYDGIVVGCINADFAELFTVDEITDMMIRRLESLYMERLYIKYEVISVKK